MNIKRLEGAAPKRWRARVRGNEVTQLWTDEYKQFKQIGEHFEAVILLINSRAPKTTRVKFWRALLVQEVLS